MFSAAVEAWYADLPRTSWLQPSNVRRDVIKQHASYESPLMETMVYRQVVLNPLQQALAQGCHLTRDTLGALLEEARVHLLNAAVEAAKVIGRSCIKQKTVRTFAPRAALRSVFVRAHSSPLCQATKLVVLCIDVLTTAPESCEPTLNTNKPHASKPCRSFCYTLCRSHSSQGSRRGGSQNTRSTGCSWRAWGPWRHTSWATRCAMTRTLTARSWKKASMRLRRLERLEGTSHPEDAAQPISQYTGCVLGCN